MTTITRTEINEIIERLADKSLRRAELFDGEYIVFEDGAVISIKSNKRLKLGKTPQGYLMCYFWHKGVPFKIPHHRVLATHFIPNPHGKLEVNHINGVRHDNRLENLEWCTSSENKAHAWRCLPRKKTYAKRGHESPSAKQVYQFTLEGRLVGIWGSLTDAAGLNLKISNISACCAGRRKSCGGFLWSFSPTFYSSNH